MDQGGHLRAVGAKHLIIVARHLATRAEKVDEEVWIYRISKYLNHGGGMFINQFKQVAVVYL